MTYKELKANTETLKREITCAIEHLDPKIKGVINISETCISTSLSLLGAARTFDPFYYNGKEQLKAIAAVAERADSLEALISRLNSIVKTGKLPDKRPLNPEILQRVSEVLKKYECEEE